MNNDPILCSSCGTTLDAAAPGGLCPLCLMAGAMLPTDSPTGMQTAPPTLEQFVAAFPQLEVLALIGGGGMGAVFRARQPKLNRLVALKVLPALLAERDPAFAERFEREGQMLARLHHPNIVTVYDSGRAGDFFYLLMEHVDGVNLRQAMRASRFSPAQALGIVPRICDALQFAHDEGVLHRDIKPENILLDAKGRVKLADFGIGKIIGEVSDSAPVESASLSSDASLTQAGTALGTPQYMAPEQREQPELVDHRADIYSLGVVFYELLTGELPTGKFAPPSALTGSDPRIDAIVLQAMEKERSLRQQSAGEVRTQVETVAAGGNALSGPAAKNAGETEALPPRFSRTAIAGAVWLGIVLLGVLTIAGPVKMSLPWWQVLLSFAVILPTVSAPFGVTILGWIAVSQIRRSSGKLYGLGLALFDALLFPLLAINVGIWLTVGSIWRANPPQYGTTLGDFLVNHPVAVPIFAAFLCIATDFLIICRASRAANMPIDGIGKSVLSTTPSLASRLKLGLLIGLVITAGVAGERLVSDYLVRRAGAAIPEEMARQAIASQLKPYSLRCEKMEFEPNTVSPSDVIVRFTGLEELRGGHGANVWKPTDGLLNLRTLDGRLWQAAGTGDLGHVQFTFELSQPFQVNSAAQNLSFGPVVERVVELNKNPGGYNLETGEFIPFLPTKGEETLTAAYGWMKRFGVDVIPDANSNSPAIYFVGALVHQVDEMIWNDAASRLINSAELPPAPIAGSFERNMASLYTSAWGPPKTYLIRTQKGTAGVLQLVGVTDNSQGVKVRYKLVKSSEDQVSAKDEGPQAAPQLRAVMAQLAEAQTKYREDHPIIQELRAHIKALEAPGKPSVAEAPPGKSIFGPVIERVVNDDGPQKDFLIDFDTGQLFTPPPDIGPRNPKGIEEWIAKNGIDAMGETGESVRGLMGFDLIAFPFPNDRWETATPSACDDLQLGKPGTPVPLSGKGPLPATYLFKTREGSMGLLQITGFTESPRSVKIRYKLVQGATSVLSSATPSINRDFVVFHPASQGTAVLNAARDFVIEKKWQLKGEGGGNAGVTIEAAGPEGKRITFNETSQPGGMMRFTVSAEEGAQMSAREIGGQLWRQIGWGNVKAATAGKSAGEPYFGPVMERELFANDTLTDAFLDLDTDEVLSAPKELLDSLRAKGRLYGGMPQAGDIREWMKSRGADVVARVKNSDDPSELLQVDGLGGILMGEKPLKLGGCTFDTVTVELLTRDIQQSEKTFASLNSSERQWVYGHDFVFAFKTREGRTGLLEILEAKPGRVKVRYKLVQGAHLSDLNP